MPSPSKIVSPLAEAAPLADLLAATPHDRPQHLFDHRVDGDMMVGLARLRAADVAGLWERHDGGDELLFLIAGELTVRLRSADAADETRVLGAGEMIRIPRGVAHSFVVHTPELALVFVTPRDRNSGWSDDGRPPPLRHA